MEPITYHVRRSRILSVTTYMLVAAAITVATPLLLSALFYLADEKLDLGLFAVFALLLAVVIPETVRVLRRSSQVENCLRLEEDGLTRMSWGRIHRWDWHELSDFEIRGMARFGVLTPDRYVPIVKSGEGGGLRSRLARRGLGESIRDLYDTPLDEIVETLNAYRERALTGEMQTGGPQATGPEPA